MDKGLSTFVPFFANIVEHLEIEICKTGVSVPFRIYLSEIFDACLDVF